MGGCVGCRERSRIGALHRSQAEQVPSDHHPLDLARSLPDLGELRVAKVALDAVLSDVAVPTVHLDGVVRDVPVTLRNPTEAAQKGALGITGYDIAYSTEAHDPLTAVTLGARRTVDAATLVLRGLGDFINNIANPPISGPVGIVNTIGIVRTALPPVFLIWLVAALSANLGIVNALPFPPLDGGKVATSLVQAIVGDRANKLIERFVYAGLLLMFALVIWVTLFDVGILQRT